MDTNKANRGANRIDAMSELYKNIVHSILIK